MKRHPLLPAGRSLATADAKAGIDRQIAGLTKDRDAVEARLGEARAAGAGPSKEFQADVGRTTLRLRKSPSQTVA